MVTGVYHIEGFCGELAVDKVGVDIWEIVCPKRKGVEAITRAPNAGAAVENVCGLFRKRR